jgi:hypothetical protein
MNFPGIRERRLRASVDEFAKDISWDLCSPIIPVELPPGRPYKEQCDENIPKRWSFKELTFHFK